MATDLSKAQDYGFKIAQPGFDAKTAGDYQLLFNSSWPSISVAFQQNIPLSGTTGTVTHNLGFPPFVRVYEVVGGVATTISDGVGGGASFKFDSTTVTVTGTSGRTYQVVCYNVNLTSGAKYKLLTPPAIKQLYNSSYGMKIAKANKDINSKDLRDFILHTRAQSPALLAVLTQADAVLNGSQYDLKYTNQQNYTAWVFGFWQGSGNNYWQPVNMYNQVVPGLYIDNSTTFRLTYGNVNDHACLVVLRDPLFAANTVQVTY